MKQLNAPKSNDELTEFEVAYLSEADQQMPSGNNYYGKQSGDQKKQIFKILMTLRKHWLMIVSLCLLVTTLSIVYVAQKPDIYQAKARVQVNNETNPASAGGGRSSAGSIIINYPVSDPVYFATQLQILESGELLRRVVKTLDLENNQAFLRPGRSEERTIWQNVLRLFGMHTPPVKPVEEKNGKAVLVVKKDQVLDQDKDIEKLAPYVGLLKRNLKITPIKDSRTSVKETRLIEIEFTHQDPEVAAKIVNTIADTYILHNLEQKVQTNAAAGDFLQKRVAELQSDIRLGEERLMNYGKHNQILSLDAGQNTVVQRLAQLSNELGSVENQRIAAEAALRAAQQNPVLAVVTEDKDARTSALESQLIALRQRLAQLKTDYTDEWYEVVQARKDIEGIEKELATRRTRAVTTELASLEQTYRETSAKEKELRANFEKQRNDVLAQNEAAINYRIIQQEIDTNKVLLDGLLAKSRENDVILNGTPNNVLFVDRALTPRSPVGPERSKDIFVALLGSLGAGVGLAFLLDWINDKVRYTNDLESDFGMPLLAQIPDAAHAQKRRSLPARLGFKKMNGARHNYDLLSFEEPVISEAYHQLRTYLLLSTPGGPPQRILITSGQPGEGKTVTALNLARSLAETGSSVLLIDGDLRYPRLHTIYNVSNKTGLATLLTAKNLSADQIEATIRTARNNLKILTAGPTTPNPANLLCSVELRELLRTLSTQFTHIVIDSPPVTMFADSVMMSTYADAVVVVARDNQTTGQSILQTKKMLQDVGAKIIGIVLNGTPLTQSNYYNYGYYQALEESTAESGAGILKLNQ